MATDRNIIFFAFVLSFLASSLCSCERCTTRARDATMATSTMTEAAERETLLRARGYDAAEVSERSETRREFLRVALVLVSCALVLGVVSAFTGANVGAKAVNQRLGAAPVKSFAWLIQGKDAPGEYQRWASDARDVFELAYMADDSIEEGDPFRFHVPGTNWATGRNALMERALRHGLEREDGSDGYEYYVFIDDDLPPMMKPNATEYMAAFERELMNKRPMVAYTPSSKGWATGRARGDPRGRHGHDIVGPNFYDPNLQAFHTSTLGLLLPIDASRDSPCVGFSSMTTHLMSFAFFSHGIVGFQSRDILLNPHEEHAHRGDEPHATKYQADKICGAVVSINNAHPTTQPAKYLAKALIGPQSRPALREATRATGGKTPIRFMPKCAERVPVHRHRANPKWINANIDSKHPMHSLLLGFMKKFPSLFPDDADFYVDKPWC